MDTKRMDKAEETEHFAGAQGGRRPTGAPAKRGRSTEVSPEQSKQSKRPHRTVQYKLSVLEVIDKLKKENPRGIGAYLRTEGIYSKTVERWQQEKEQGLLSKHRAGTRGHIKEVMKAENARLKRRLATTEKKLKQAELLIDLQKKISQLTVTDLPSEDNTEK